MHFAECGACLELVLGPLCQHVDSAAVVVDSVNHGRRALYELYSLDGGEVGIKGTECGEPVDLEPVVLVDREAPGVEYAAAAPVAQAVGARYVFRNLQEPLLAICLVAGFYVAFTRWSIPITHLLVMGLLLERTVTTMGRMQQQLQRVGSGRGRPLLKGGREGLQARLEQLREVRDPLYREAADVIIATDGRRVPRVADLILRELGLRRAEGARRRVDGALEELDAAVKPEGSSLRDIAFVGLGLALLVVGWSSASLDARTEPLGTILWVLWFLVAGRAKWGQESRLVLLLPHGHEGQGPEHSNARPERFLQLSAEYNIVVANITEPSNFFHLLRRQLTWDFRKPCVVMSPKSLLRHPKVVSPLSEFTSGRFRELILDEKADPKKVTRIIMCSGKIFYDLEEAREKEKVDDVAIFRVEQLHPLPKSKILEAVKTYPDAEIIWVQEEPENMGYWTYIVRMLYKYLRMDVIARKHSASPATGYMKVHMEEQKGIVNKALRIK